MKHIYALLAAVIAMTGTAHAGGRISSNFVVPLPALPARTNLPERPGMQTREGDYSFCDDSGCYERRCWHSELYKQSICVDSPPQDQSDP